MTLFDHIQIPTASRPAGMPRLTRREVLVPSQVVPSYRDAYTRIAREILSKRPGIGAVELERRALGELERRLSTNGAYLVGG